MKNAKEQVKVPNEPTTLANFLLNLKRKLSMESYDVSKIGGNGFAAIQIFENWAIQSESMMLSVSQQSAIEEIIVYAVDLEKFGLTKRALNLSTLISLVNFLNTLGRIRNAESPTRNAKDTEGGFIDQAGNFIDGLIQRYSGKKFDSDAGFCQRVASSLIMLKVLAESALQVQLNRTDIDLIEDTILRAEEQRGNQKQPDYEVILKIAH